MQGDMRMLFKRISKKGFTWGFKEAAMILFILICLIAIIAFIIWTRQRGYSIVGGFFKFIGNVFKAIL